MEGSPVFGAYFIMEGKVKVISTGFNNKEQIVRLATDGHILGHRGCSEEIYPIGAIALDDSLVCFFDNDILYEAFKANFEFLYAIMMYYSTELRKCELRTKYFTQMTVEEKVTFALLYIIETFGLCKKEKSLNIILTRQEIADISGTNAAQVSRAISSLRQKHIISTQGKKIFVENYEKMKNIIERYTSVFF